MKYFVIGERELVLAFALVGVKGVTAVNREEALEAFRRVTGYGATSVGESIVTEKIIKMDDEAPVFAAEYLSVDNGATSTSAGGTVTVNGKQKVILYGIIEDKESDVGVVTNSFHIWRAVEIAKSQGHEMVSGVPAKTLMPLGIHYVVREFFGFVKWKIL